MSEKWGIPLILRGEIAPPEQSASSTLPLEQLTTTPRLMSDLTALRFDDVVEYLESLSARLAPADNPHMQEAYELSRRTSPLPDAALRQIYEQLPQMFSRASVTHRANTLLPPECLDGWTELPALRGARTRARVRAFGARTLHIIAGNTPAIGAATILNNALTRGDALIKTPSNDLLTTVAIARTMIDMAPDHPLTRHVAVAHWKGGDARIEQHVYDPRRIEKIVAWGGVASIRHVTRSLTPGLDLITLDPKWGVAILDACALACCSEMEWRDVAGRLATDIGSLSQEACFNTRVAYLIARNPGEAALAQHLASLTYQALRTSTAPSCGPARRFDPELKAELDALRLVDSGHVVIGAKHGEGGIVVSTGAPVEFAHRLTGRVANIVVIDHIDRALAMLGPGSQTVSVYPATLRGTIRDRLAQHGAQRIVPLGGAAMDPDLATPHDGMELLRRMCKWVVEEIDPSAVAQKA